ncbi:MAG TPA: ATP-binding protein [Burkholderiaceae bacterium]|nr:ATP-binding protein [Burkholderiaceae bacterium]
MRISTRLKLTGLISVGVVAAIGAVLLFTTQQVKQELVKNEAAGEVLKAVTAVRYLTLEYVMRHEERARMQRQLSQASLLKLLTSTSKFSEPEELAILDGFLRTHTSVDLLFSQLVVNQHERQAATQPSQILEELDSRLTGQIANQTQAMISDALRLSERSRAGVLKAQQRASVAVVAFGGMVLLVIALTIFLVLRSVTRPLARLRDGTAMVGAGNLDYRLDVTTRDEIGDLARAFDAMTGTLKGTTVSRDQLVESNELLQSEIVERKQAEQKTQAQLGRLNLLHQITRAIGERQDLPSILQVVVSSLEDQLPVDFGCMCLYEQSDNALKVTSVGLRSAALAQELAMTDQARVDIDANGLSRCVQGELVYEPDISQLTFPFSQRLAQGGLRSLVVAPLLTESRVFGVFITARQAPNAFSSGECEFLRQLSEHVALAAHQSQLYGTLQQAYDDLRLTQQAVMQQERLGALGQMASGIAHDINNAISPVTLYTETLLENEPGLSARARNYLETIQRSIEDVAQTVTRMGEFYRQREPQLMLKPVPLNLLLQQVADLTRARWSDMPQVRGVVIQLRMELAPDLPAVMGIESEIREALINLFFNAIDAMPDGGTLALRTKVAQGAPDAEEIQAFQHVHLEVADTGMGMDEATRRRCLEPFFTTKGTRGTGLGLAMVYGVVERHSAEIEIDSTPGQGTTVRLVFPVPLAAPAPVPAATPGAVSPDLRILVVDDDPMLLKSLRDVLDAEGHIVATANGGQAGIDAFQAAQAAGDAFSVVITDLGMPHVDGRKVASAVKQMSPATPVILLTGWGRRLMSSGEVPPHVDCVVSKPPKLRELREAFVRLLSCDA